MFCPQCGANNADRSIVCAQCGGSLQPGQPVPPNVPGVLQTPLPSVQNHLVFAILATIFCCVPSGIPAIVYAASVNDKVKAGDFAGAKAAAENAKMWCWISFGVGLLWILVVVVGTIRRIGAQ